MRIKPSPLLDLEQKVARRQSLMFSDPDALPFGVLFGTNIILCSLHPGHGVDRIARTKVKETNFHLLRRHAGMEAERIALSAWHHAGGSHDYKKIMPLRLTTHLWVLFPSGDYEMGISLATSLERLLPTEDFPLGVLTFGWVFSRVFVLGAT